MHQLLNAENMMLDRLADIYIFVSIFECWHQGEKQKATILLITHQLNPYSPISGSI